MAEIFAATKPCKLLIDFNKDNLVIVHLGRKRRRLHVGDTLELDDACMLKVEVPVKMYALVEAVEALEGKY